MTKTTTSSSAVAAAAANAFETAADAGDAIAAADALRAITQAARTPGAARDAVPSLASRLAGSKNRRVQRRRVRRVQGWEGSEGWDSQGYLPGYLPDLLRALRNACAGDRDATDATCLGVAPVPNALRRLIPVLAAESERESTEGDATGPECVDASDASNVERDDKPGGDGSRRRDAARGERARGGFGRRLFQAVVRAVASSRELRRAK